MPLPYLKGVLEGLWQAFGSLFLASDQKIKTIPGRLVQISFWFVAFILLSAYAADLATRLSISLKKTSISSYKDISGKKVGCFTQYAHMIENFKATAKSYANEASNGSIMLDDLKNDDLDAVALPKPLAIYLASQDCDLAIVGDVFVDDYYGIAFKSSIDTDVYKAITVDLQTLTENFYTRDLENEYFLEADSDPCYDTITLPIDLGQVGGLWSVLAIGTIFSLVTHFIIKRLLQKRKKNDKLNPDRLFEPKPSDDSDLMVKFEKILGSSESKIAEKMKELESVLGQYSNDCLKFEDSFKKLSDALEEF